MFLLVRLAHWEVVCVVCDGQAIDVGLPVLRHGLMVGTIEVHVANRVLLVHGLAHHSATWPPCSVHMDALQLEDGEVVCGMALHDRKTMLSHFNLV